MALSFYGPALGFIIVLAFLGVAGWLISAGFGIEGTVLGSVDIASLAAVFAIGKQLNRTERSLDEVVPGKTATNKELNAAAAS